MRGSPVSETRPPPPWGATLKAERATVAAKGRQIETEAAPIRYVAELLGTNNGAQPTLASPWGAPSLSCASARLAFIQDVCRIGPPAKEKSTGRVPQPNA